MTHALKTSHSFTGSSGQAIISDNNAYLVTDSRYWVQARQQLDSNWVLIKAGAHDGPKDWAEWLLDRARDARIGIDARMISYEKAASLKSILNQRGSKRVYPTQNLVDLIWAEKPTKSLEMVYIQSTEFAGMDIYPVAIALIIEPAFRTRREI